MRFIKTEAYFPLIVGVHLLLWVVDLTVLYDGPLALNPNESPVSRVLGEVFSSWVITVFGFNLLMTTRARWVERIFGGLDKMYLIHRRAGIIAVVLLLLHFGVVPRDPDFTIGKPLGFAALVLIFMGVVFAAAPVFKRKVPYHKWVKGHRILGVFYVVGIVHAALVEALIWHLPLVRVYVIAMASVGVLSWLYRLFGPVPSARYAVSAVHQPTQSLVQLDLAPVDARLGHHAGQFAFFRFERLAPAESHPFTIASAPDTPELRIAVKVSGDFTAHLLKDVRVGDRVVVEGPYGHLTRKNIRADRQVWIAGGIGVTPFIALAADLKSTHGATVSLYWSVRTAADAFCTAEFERLAAEKPNFSYRLWCSDKSGYLSREGMPEAAQWVDADYIICGPIALRDALVAQLRAAGVAMSRIHYEEFTFR